MDDFYPPSFVSASESVHGETGSFLGEAPLLGGKGAALVCEGGMGMEGPRVGHGMSNPGLNYFTPLG